MKNTDIGNNKIKLLISNRQIQSKVRSLANKISKDFSGKEILILFISNGSFVFTADLIRKISIKMRVDSIKASSYVGKNSSGKVKISMSPKISLKGANIIVVDDIIDTGRTISSIVEYLLKKKPAQIRTCVLLDKPSRRIVSFRADYVGFEIKDIFVVGYGLDYNGYYRNVPCIGYIE